MPKKAPRFQLANRVVILTFFLSALIVGFYQLTTRGIGVAWMGFIAVLYLLIPPLYRRIFHLKPTYLIDMVLMIFILLAFNLGVALRLYGSIPWYDNAVHGLSVLCARGGQRPRAGTQPAHGGGVLLLLRHDDRARLGAHRVRRLLVLRP